MVFFLLLSSLVFGSSKDLHSDLKKGDRYQAASSLGMKYQSGKLSNEANKAIEVLVYASVGELRRRGAYALAGRISHEYESTYRDFITSRGVGDHAGILWLLKIHAEIEYVIGEKLCRSLRIHDLWTLAYTVPVVFDCEGKVERIEYSYHFIPFTGVTSYWTTYGACIGASLGLGVKLVCGFAGMGVEQVMTSVIAPPMSEPFWRLSCKVPPV